MFKWLLAVLALFFALFTALIVFSITGVIEPQTYLLQAIRETDWAEPYVNAYDIGLDVEKWRRQEDQKLVEAWSDVEEARAAIQQARTALEQRESALNSREERLEARLAANRNVQRLAELYTEMAPQEAVEILKLMEEAMVAEILLSMAPQDASIILASMPPELAASLSRQLQ